MGKLHGGNDEGESLFGLLHHSQERPGEKPLNSLDALLLNAEDGKHSDTPPTQAEGDD